MFFVKKTKNNTLFAVKSHRGNATHFLLKQSVTHQLQARTTAVVFHYCFSRLE